MNILTALANELLNFVLGKATTSNYRAYSSEIRAYFNGAKTDYIKWATPFGNVMAPSGGVISPIGLPASYVAGGGAPAGAITSVDLVHTSYGTLLSGLTFGLEGSGAETVFSSLQYTSTPQLLNANFKIPKLIGAGILMNEILRTALITRFGGTASTDQLVSLSTGNVSFMRIYSGSPPASADDAPTGTLLWESSVISSAWGAPAGGGAALVSPVTANALATGTVGYARIVNVSNGAAIQVNSVGPSGAVVTGGSDTTLGASFSVNNFDFSISPLG